MGSRKWVSDDGSQFDKKADMVEYEARTPHINHLEGLLNDTAMARKIVAYFEKNFRVPKPRKPQVKKMATPTTTVAPTSAKQKGK